MNKNIHPLLNIFEAHQNSKTAQKQSAYMRNQFAFYGIVTPLRKKLQQPFLKKDALPSKEVLTPIIQTLWQHPKREVHYFAMDLLRKYSKAYELENMALFEQMITTHSWWDTVDIIAPNMVGDYLKQYPKEQELCVERWLASENIWLQRTAILFQLRYKEALDRELLTHVITKLQDSKEFFVNKAIGWILREYGKTNPQWVLEFIENNELHPLSRREGLRLLMR